MSNQTLTGTELAIAIGPSLAGAFILIAAIIGAVVFFVKERRRRKESQGSAYSGASLFTEGRFPTNLCFPKFNNSQSPSNLKRNYRDTSSPHLVQPWRENCKVFTIPVTPSDSSKTSTIDSQSDRLFANNVNNVINAIKANNANNANNAINANNANNVINANNANNVINANNDTVKEKYYYNFNNTTTHTSTNNNRIPSITTITSNSNNDNNKPNHATSPATITTKNSNSNQNQSSTTTNTPATSSRTPETNSGDPVVVRRSREVSKLVKAETPIRSTILTEDAWNSTLDDIFNSALSLHEPGTHNLVNVRGTVFPHMN